MRLTEALAKLRRLPPAFTTREASGMLGVEPAHASVLLGRLASSDHVFRLAQGRWAFRGAVSALAVPEALTRPIPSYVSLQSALYHHGMIEQIPDVVYAATLGPTRRITTPIATVSLHQITPDFFFGFEPSGVTGAHVAVAEKALLDFFYLRQARSRMFRALPELELPRKFSAARARSMLRRIRSHERRTLVTRLLEEALRSAGRTGAA
jgi:predicted transcriptional regulator of viral defense system